LFVLAVPAWGQTPAQSESAITTASSSGSASTGTSSSGNGGSTSNPKETKTQDPKTQTEATQPASTGAGQETAAAKTTDERVADLEGKVEGINEGTAEMKSVVDALRKIKLTGYIQAQYQWAEAPGAKSFAGGDFPSTANSRFTIRRGRLKVNYDNTLTQYVLQVDATERGLVLKDAYVSVKEPWLQTFGLTAGVFNRPFGFEISYSSSNRESPERTRLFQTLFPGERDLGAKIEVMPTRGWGQYFNFQGGWFAGNGVAAETDSKKDFIGRIGFQIPITSRNLAIDGGFSTYQGAVRLDDGKSAFVLDSPTNFGTVASRRYFDRDYYGADLQLYYDLPVIGGFSFRTEYIQGKQPGTATSSNGYRVGNGDLYMRDFKGYYFWYVQNIREKNQFVIKYDVYDPNRDVKGANIGLPANAKLSAADLRYNTFGIGWVYHWDANVKFTAYYDFVSNEKANPAGVGALAPFRGDVKDDVLTLRVQYKF
jgi:hypothetical protein